MVRVALVTRAVRSCAVAGPPRPRPASAWIGASSNWKRSFRPTGSRSVSPPNRRAPCAASGARSSQCACRRSLSALAAVHALHLCHQVVLYGLLRLLDLEEVLRIRCAFGQRHTGRHLVAGVDPQVGRVRHLDTRECRHRPECRVRVILLGDLAGDAGDLTSTMLAPSWMRACPVHWAPGRRWRPEARAGALCLIGETVGLAASSDPVSSTGTDAPDDLGAVLALDERSHQPRR